MQACTQTHTIFIGLSHSCGLMIGGLTELGNIEADRNQHKRNQVRDSHLFRKDKPG